MVEVLAEAGGTLSCCGQPMVELEERTADKATEKHVPVIEKTEKGYKVTVGTTLHPMTGEHWIQWIELVTDKHVLREYLDPNQPPVAEFVTEDKALFAREYCNLHGLWRVEA